MIAQEENGQRVGYLLDNCSSCCAGAIGMLLYGKDLLEVVSPSMTDYIAAQDAKVLLSMLASGPVLVATDTQIPVCPCSTVQRLVARRCCGPNGRCFRSRVTAPRPLYLRVRRIGSQRLFSHALR